MHKFFNLTTFVNSLQFKAASCFNWIGFFTAVGDLTNAFYSLTNAASKDRWFNEQSFYS